MVFPLFFNDIQTLFVLLALFYVVTESMTNVKNKYHHYNISISFNTCFDSSLRKVQLFLFFMSLQS